MAGEGQSRLYTPEVLALAVDLARYPLTPDLPVTGEARSRTCGSTLRLGLALDDGHRVARVGVQATACAVGQAAAALFARGAPGLTTADLESHLHNIERWLAGEGSPPDWPGFESIDRAQAYPARHGAILLPWKAAQAALGKADTAG